METTKCPADARAIEKRATCGYVALPLDREKPAGKKIRVYFEHYPHSERGKTALSTVLSIEGGPGYPTAADRDARADSERDDGQQQKVKIDLRGGQADDVELAGLQAGHRDRRIGRRLEDEPVDVDVVGVPDGVVPVGDEQHGVSLVEGSDPV